MSDVDMGTATDEESSEYHSHTQWINDVRDNEQTDNVVETSGTNDKVTELNVAFSF